MNDFAKLLSAVAELIDAAAWPAAFVIIAAVFRTEIQKVLLGVLSLFDRVKKASVAGVALELDRVANAEINNNIDSGGKITPQQIEASERISIQAQDVSSRALLGELDRLCLEYDAVRQTLPPGDARTRAMTRILIKMRSLAPSVVDFLEAYKGSGSPGSRLAAVAMMQMVPSVADPNWLKDRFSGDHPFVFYHAALALQNLANRANTREEKVKLRKIAQLALDKLQSFKGTPDSSSLEVLETLIRSLR